MPAGRDWKAVLRMVRSGFRRKECPDQLEMSAMGEGEGGGVYAIYCRLPAMGSPAPGSQLANQCAHPSSVPDDHCNFEQVNFPWSGFPGLSKKSG